MVLVDIVFAVAFAVAVERLEQRLRIVAVEVPVGPSWAAAFCRRGRTCRGRCQPSRPVVDAVEKLRIFLEAHCCQRYYAYIQLK